MLNGRKLILDTMNEVYRQLRPFADGEFWDLDQHDLVPGAIYILGRKQMVEYSELTKHMAETGKYTVVFGNSAEGSSTIMAQLGVLGLDQLVKQHKILLISGGDISPEYPYLLHDHFLCRVFDYEGNHHESQRINEIYEKSNKPYKFLFLNGRARPHRKYLYERIKSSGLLDHALWTMLDGRGSGSKTLSLIRDGREIISDNTPITRLPDYYEVPKYRGKQLDTTHPHQFIKYDMFGQDWGDIYLLAEPYIDTYFSLVTETVYDVPYSFRTEKIAKPLAMGHPWICATNAGFYRDLRNLGFKTFHGILDESFDSIDDTQTRIDRVFDVVSDLCKQDLNDFMLSCQDICKYNQQFLKEFVARHRAEFPNRFRAFINHYARP